MVLGIIVEIEFSELWFLFKLVRYETLSQLNVPRTQNFEIRNPSNECTPIRKVFQTLPFEPFWPENGFIVFVDLELGRIVKFVLG
jgi:hypothetical protein